MWRASPKPPRRPRTKLFALWLTLLAAPALADETAAVPQGPVPQVRRFPIEMPEFTGLSDLTIDGAGQFYAIPERKRALLPLNLTRDNPGLDGQPIPIDGIPDGLDTESVSFLARTKESSEFVIGTESQVNRRLSDAIFFVKVEAGRARVTHKIALPYRLWNMQATDNEGIEGLCVAANRILATGETAGLTEDDKRFAPLGRYDIASRRWVPFKLMLTSGIGRISALACRPAPDGQQIEVLAMERYIGVAHLLRFRVPQNGAGGVITPEIFADLGKVLDAVPNLEGIEWSTQDDIYLLSDNDFGIVTGPTQVVVIPRGWR